MQLGLYLGFRACSQKHQSKGLKLKQQCKVNAVKLTGSMQAFLAVRSSGCCSGSELQPQRQVEATTAGPGAYTPGVGRGGAGVTWKITTASARRQRARIALIALCLNFLSLSAAMSCLASSSGAACV